MTLNKKLRLIQTMKIQISSTRMSNHLIHPTKRGAVFRINKFSSIRCYKKNSVSLFAGDQDVIDVTHDPALCFRGLFGGLLICLFFILFLSHNVTPIVRIPPSHQYIVRQCPESS